MRVKAINKQGIEELAETVLQSTKSISNSTIAVGLPILPMEQMERYSFESCRTTAAANKKIFARYNFISEVYQESVKPKDTLERSVSEKIDCILTHKFFGLVILIAILLLVFQTIFSWANMPMDLLDTRFRRDWAILFATRCPKAF
ncbi:MAG: hypothetical protein WKF73_16485 [Nocardioidaceae bacterium]